MNARLRFTALLVLLTALFAMGPAAAQPDAENESLARQLNAVYDNIEGLEPVSVTVSAGVVTLEGEVVSDQLRERAATLASEFEGVVEVQNDVTVSTAVVDRIGPALERFEERTLRVVYNLPLLLVGIVVLALAWWFSRWLSRREFIARRVRGNPFMRDIVRQLIRATIMVAAILFVLDLLELTAMVGAVLGAAGVATLAIGFAFRDLIENYIASILLSIRQPFEPHDLVEIGDHCGRVSRLTSRATILITLDGNHVRIPNSTVFKAEMINYSRNPRRRFEFDVGVDVELELSPVQSLAEQVLCGVDGVMRDPEPFCLVTQLGDSSVILRAHGWVDQTAHDFGRVRSEAIRQVKEAFDNAGIVMPEPIYNIKMLEKKDAAGTGAAASAAQPEPGAGRPDGADTRKRDPIETAVHEEMGEGQNLLDEHANKE